MRQENKGESSPKEPAGCGDDRLPDLGLPVDYDPHFIPSDQALQQAAIRRLHDEYAFLLLHQDTPAAISARLDDLAAVARATSQIKGDHQAKAIRLGLALHPQYWLSARKLDQWIHLIIPLLKAALELGDRALLGRVYQLWGIYLYLARSNHEASVALDKAIQNAEYAGRADLELLFRAERFNMEFHQMPLGAAEARAAELLGEARRLNYPYVQGRVYLSLSLLYARCSLPRRTFMYAQQALCCFSRCDDEQMTMQAVSSMAGVLGINRHYSTAYRTRLVHFLLPRVAQSVNPWFESRFYFSQGVECYHRGDVDGARCFLLAACVRMRGISQAGFDAPLRHMLGLVYTRCREWAAARYYLRLAYRLYEQAGNPVMMLHARHALAYIPYEQGDLLAALDELHEVVQAAETLTEKDARDHLINLLRADIARIG